MNNQKYYPASVLIILLFALYYATTRYFLPEIEKGAYDVAAAIWFVFTPLYLLIKRLWLMRKLDRWIVITYDIIICVAVQLLLGWTAFQTTPDFSLRVYTVWLICIVLWGVIFTTKPEQ